MSAERARVRALVRALALRPHPEGGRYAETFRSPLTVAAPQGARSAGTAIWFLLIPGEVSRWHRVAADEAWHWYEGGELALFTCAGPGAPVIRHRLGPVARGRRPQLVVPAGCWQAARPRDRHVLVGCTVAPGFAFADFALIDPAGPLAAWLRPQAGADLVDGAPRRRPR